MYGSVRGVPGDRHSYRDKPTGWDCQTIVVVAVGNVLELQGLIEKNGPQEALAFLSPGSSAPAAAFSACLIPTAGPWISNG